MSCKFIDNIKTGEKERSLSFDRTVEITGNTDLSVRMHKQMQSNFFKNKFGDWIKARNETIQGKYKDPIAAFEANDVSIFVNTQLEPLIMYYSSNKSDLNSASFEFLGDLEINEFPSTTHYNYPVVVNATKIMERSLFFN